MKTIIKTFLPDEIKHNGKKYVRGIETKESIKVKVLNKRLIGVVDLHGVEYKPTIWFFNKVIN
jgi:hypothetical protein